MTARLSRDVSEQLAEFTQCYHQRYQTVLQYSHNRASSPAHFWLTTGGLRPAITTPGVCLRSDSYGRSSKAYDSGLSQCFLETELSNSSVHPNIFCRLCAVGSWQMHPFVQRCCCFLLFSFLSLFPFSRLVMPANKITKLICSSTYN